MSEIGKTEEQTGGCTAKTSHGVCPCLAFRYLRTDQAYRICQCTHTQQLHRMIEEKK
jgi:hypothetical protein